MDFKNKYIKYKNKYLELKKINQSGGNGELIKIDDKFYKLDQYQENKIYLLYQKTGDDIKIESLNKIIYNENNKSYKYYKLIKESEFKEEKSKQEEAEINVSSKIEGPISSKIEGPESYYYLTYKDKGFLMMGDRHREVKNCYGESGMSVVNYIKNILKENKNKKCIDFFLESEYYGSFNLDDRSEEYVRKVYAKSRNKSNGLTMHLRTLRDFFLVNHNKNDYFRFHETDIRQTLLDKINSSNYRSYSGLISPINYPNLPVKKWTDKERSFFIAGENVIKKKKEILVRKGIILKNIHNYYINKNYNEIKKLRKELEEIDKDYEDLNKNIKIHISMDKKFFVDTLITIMEYYIGNNKLTKDQLKKLLEIFSLKDKITDGDVKDEIKMKYFITKQKEKCDPSIVNIIIKEIIESFKKEILDEKNIYSHNSKYSILNQFAVKMVDLYTLLRMFRSDDGSSRERKATERKAIKGCSDNEFKNIIGYYGSRHTQNMVEILQKIGAKLIFKTDNNVDGTLKQCLDIGDFVPFQDKV